MKTLQYDGGAAFPQPQGTFNGTPYSSREVEGDSGMSLRDWFAGQALHTAWAGLARSEDERMGEQVGTYHLNPGDDIFTCAKYTAIRAYEIADEMIAERNPLPWYPPHPPCNIDSNQQTK
jgi:hypothetical protein